jgi:hypothetical protein
MKSHVRAECVVLLEVHEAESGPRDTLEAQIMSYHMQRSYSHARTQTCKPACFCCSKKPRGEVVLAVILSLIMSEEEHDRVCQATLSRQPPMNAKTVPLFPWLNFRCRFGL